MREDKVSGLLEAHRLMLRSLDRLSRLNETLAGLALNCYGMPKLRKIQRQITSQEFH